MTLTRRGLFRALCGAAAAPAIAEALPQLPLKPQLPQMPRIVGHVPVKMPKRFKMADIYIDGERYVDVGRVMKLEYVASEWSSADASGGGRARSATKDY